MCISYLVFTLRLKTLLTFSYNYLLVFTFGAGFWLKNTTNQPLSILCFLTIVHKGHKMILISLNHLLDTLCMKRTVKRLVIVTTRNWYNSVLISRKTIKLTSYPLLLLRSVVIYFGQTYKNVRILKSLNVRILQTVKPRSKCAKKDSSNLQVLVPFWLETISNFQDFQKVENFVKFTF